MAETAFNPLLLPVAVSTLFLPIMAGLWPIRAESLARSTATRADLRCLMAVAWPHPIGGNVAAKTPVTSMPRSPLLKST